MSSTSVPAPEPFRGDSACLLLLLLLLPPGCRSRPGREPAPSGIGWPPQLPAHLSSGPVSRGKAGPPRYDGRIAVLTGASSGIGRRLALDLAQRGGVVVGLA